MRESAKRMRKRGNVEICRQKAESRKERRKSSSSICIRALAHQDHVVVALLEPLGQEWFGLHQRQRPHCRNWLLDCLPAWCPCYPLERVVELFETDDQEPQPPHKQQQPSPQAKEPQAIVDLSPTMCQVRSCTGHDCAHTHAHTHAHTRTPLHTHAHAHTHTHTHAHTHTHTHTHSTHTRTHTRTQHTPVSSHAVVPKCVAVITVGRKPTGA